MIKKTVEAYNIQIMLIYVNINKRLLVTLKYSERDPTDEILRAFKLFDEEGKGRISLRNLKKIARELGENLTEEEL